MDGARQVARPDRPVGLSEWRGTGGGEGRVAGPLAPYYTVDERRAAAPSWTRRGLCITFVTFVARLAMAPLDRRYERRTIEI